MAFDVSVDDSALVAEIRGVFTEQLLTEVESPDTDLLQTGVLDSLKLVDLLFQLEQRFGITISMEELDTEDFRSLHSIARLVANLRAQEVPAC